mmetsp:Transcript_48896/g.84051  ORF Transcript_48896/g.84051 Transcript_48896/m.84051 type:complete len:591 (+) Transcript_48896:410-2182(+)
MLVHPSGPLGLHPHRGVSQRIPLDCFCQRRPDDPHLELAVPQLRLGAHGAQPLRDVRGVPPQGRPDRLGLPGPDRARVGHLRPAQEDRARRAPAGGGRHQHGGAHERGPVRGHGRGGEVRAGGPRPGGELGRLPPHAAPRDLRGRRPPGEAVAHERDQGLGGGHDARPHEQRELRHLPPAARADRVQLGGPQRARVGHLQAHGRADLPPGARPVLGAGGAPEREPAGRGPRRGPAGLQAGARAAGRRRARRPPLLRQGPVPADVRVRHGAGRARGLPAPGGPGAALRPGRHAPGPLLQPVQPPGGERFAAAGRRRGHLRARHLRARPLRLPGGGAAGPPARGRAGRRVRRAQPLRRPGQEPPDPDQELPERGDQEGGPAAPADGLPVLRRRLGPRPAQDRGPGGALRAAVAARAGGGAGAAREVRVLVPGRRARGAGLQARDRAGRPGPGAAVLGRGDRAGQVGRLGRAPPAVHLQHVEPREVPAAQRGHGHPAHAGGAAVHLPGLAPAGALPGPRGEDQSAGAGLHGGALQARARGETVRRGDAAGAALAAVRPGGGGLPAGQGVPGGGAALRARHRPALRPRPQVRGH